MPSVVFWSTGLAVGIRRPAASHVRLEAPGDGAEEGGAPGPGRASRISSPRRGCSPGGCSSHSPGEPKEGS